MPSLTVAVTAMRILFWDYVRTLQTVRRRHGSPLIF